MPSYFLSKCGNLNLDSYHQINRKSGSWSLNVEFDSTRALLYYSDVDSVSPSPWRHLVDADGCCSDSLPRHGMLSSLLWAHVGLFDTPTGCPIPSVDWRSFVPTPWWACWSPCWTLRTLVRWLGQIALEADVTNMQWSIFLGGNFWLIWPFNRVFSMVYKLFPINSAKCLLPNSPGS